MSHCKTSIPYQELDNFIATVANPQKDLLRILLQAQTIFGYLPEEVQTYVAGKVQLTPETIAGVVNFYTYFSTKPKGIYNIAVCLGSLCHQKGGRALLDTLKQELGIQIGETTSDGLFSISVLRCIGACGQAPLVQINGEIHGKLSPEDLKSLLADYKQKNRS